MTQPPAPHNASPSVVVAAPREPNGWTGGQYSIFRALFGLYLLVHFLHLTPWAAELFSNRGALPEASSSPLLYLFPNILALWDAPAFVMALLLIAAASAVCFAIGWRDRIAAAVMWYVLACLFGRNPLIANPAMPLVGWMLLAHVFLPVAPWGSLAAKGNVDPGSRWRMPHAIFLAAWAVMAIGYTYSGYTKLISPSWVDGTALIRVLENPLARPTVLRELLLAIHPALLRWATWGGLALELAYAPLAIFRRVRPWIWLAMVGMHISLLVLIDFADLTLGMVLLHFFTFDPAWVKPERAAGTETIFYDGHCGLCHRFVRFVLSEDAAGNTFRFAPLHGAAFETEVTAEQREGLPDSVVISTAGGQVLVRSAAVLHVMARLGGLWRVIAIVSRTLPAKLLDAMYDRIAAVRKRLFAPPADTCPMLPGHLRGRFRV